MRRGIGNGWLMEGDKFMGINFGADFTAEHEWGIADLRKCLGVEDTQAVYGLERRRCKHPDKNCIALFEEDDSLNLIVKNAYSIKHWMQDKKKLKGTYSGEYEFHGTDMVTCWNGEAFLIRVKGEENFKRLHRLHESLLAGEVAVWLGGRELFGNSGLCLAIISEVSEENAETMKKGDLDNENLKIAAEQTGIRKKIDEANEQWVKMREVESGTRCYSHNAPHSYFALSPSWKRGDFKSKYKVMFWLNPAHQDDNNWGWFSVEQLEQWLNYEGPIPKKPVKKAQPKKKK